MPKNRRRNAFTLIEVLIVVIIMAVLAATIIPQFSSSTKDAKESSLRFNLHTIRSQIELYKEHHLGNYPTLAKFSGQMTKPTDSGGDPPAAGEPSFGPYFTGEVPYNPFNNSNQIVAVAAPGAVPVAVVGGGAAGWQYDETNGGFYGNNAEAFQPGGVHAP